MKFLENIREHEFLMIENLIKRKGLLLEIGAGAGWQARKFEEKGFSVVAIDIQGTKYKESCIFNVEYYDGKTIPYPDRKFDIVFSSNVLEHIDDLTEYQSEIGRVLRDDGISVHVMPSASWRLWTFVGYYFDSIIEILIRGEDNIYFIIKHIQIKTATKSIREILSKIKILLRVLMKIPQPHGKKGNSLTEIYYFSKMRWKKLFKRNGWVNIRTKPNRLFYTGYSICGEKLSINTRILLSYILGSSCRIYLMEK